MRDDALPRKIGDLSPIPIRVSDEADEDVDLRLITSGQTRFYRWADMGCVIVPFDAEDVESEDPGSTYSLDVETARDPVTAATRAVASGVVTIATAADHGLEAAQLVVLAGFTDTALTGVVKILTIPTSKTFTYSDPDHDDAVVGADAGTVTPAGLVDLEAGKLLASTWAYFSGQVSPRIFPPSGHAFLTIEEEPTHE